MDSIADIIDRLYNTSSEAFQTSDAIAELENYIEKQDLLYIMNLGEMGSSADYIDYVYYPRPKKVYTYFPTYWNRSLLIQICVKTRFIYENEVVEI